MQLVGTSSLMETGQSWSELEDASQLKLRAKTRRSATNPRFSIVRISYHSVVLPNMITEYWVLILYFRTYSVQITEYIRVQHGICVVIRRRDPQDALVLHALGRWGGRLQKRGTRGPHISKVLRKHAVFLPFSWTDNGDRRKPARRRRCGYA